MPEDAAQLVLDWGNAASALVRRTRRQHKPRKAGSRPRTLLRAYGGICGRNGVVVYAPVQRLNCYLRTAKTDTILAIEQGIARDGATLRDDAAHESAHTARWVQFNAGGDVTSGSTNSQA